MGERPDEAGAGAQRPRGAGLVRGGLGRVDAAQEERRAEERQRVGGQRERRGQGLHQQPAHAGAAHRGQRPALVDQRVALHVLVAGHQGHEQPGVGHGEEDAQRPGRERHREHLGQAEHAQGRADRDAGQQRGPAQVRRDHGGPAVAAPVHPGPGVQGEQQAGQPDEGAEVAHLGRARRAARAPRPAAARWRRSGRRTGRCSARPSTAGRRSRAAGEGSGTSGVPGRTAMLTGRSRPAGPPQAAWPSHPERRSPGRLARRAGLRQAAERPQQREGQVQVADQAGARRPEFRVSLPVDVLVHHLLRLLAQRGQLVRR